MRHRSLLAGSLILAALLSALAGCVTVDPYPDYWPALEAMPKSGCPDISGRYRPEAIYTRRCERYGDRDYKAEWDCETALDWALATPQIEWNAEWIEIRQPDPDRIIVATPAHEWALSRSKGDFDCDSRGVEVSEHASTFSEEAQSTGMNAYMTTTMAMVATGGVNSLRRHFRRASDGSLVAELEESTNALLLAIPVHTRDLRYLRWAVWTEGENDAK